jgi:hypothetical protein
VKRRHEVVPNLTVNDLWGSTRPIHCQALPTLRVQLLRKPGMICICIGFVSVRHFQRSSACPGSTWVKRWLLSRSTFIGAGADDGLSEGAGAGRDPDDEGKGNS